MGSHTQPSMIFDLMTPEELEAEFDRIDADEFLRDGLATGPGITGADVVAALRGTPTDGGTPAFERTLLAIVAAREAAEGRA